MNPERFSPLGTTVLSTSGLWLEVETPIYRARMPLPWKLASGLDGHHIHVDWHARASFTLKTPKISVWLLAQAALYFIQQMETYGSQMEAMVWLTWSGQKWSLEIPRQEASAYQVKGESITPDDQVGMVMHSHGQLPVFFSPIDDASEQDGFLYGVIGGLGSKDWSNVSLKLRAGYAGCFLPLEVSDVFTV
jgi:hypothetical protein